MQCKHCSATIADNALICYKCGTATTEAKYQPAALPRARRGPGPVVIALVLALLILVALYYFRTV